MFGSNDEAGSTIKIIRMFGCSQDYTLTTTTDGNSGKEYHMCVLPGVVYDV